MTYEWLDLDSEELSGLFESDSGAPLGILEMRAEADEEDLDEDFPRRGGRKVEEDDWDDEEDWDEEDWDDDDLGGSSSDDDDDDDDDDDEEEWD